MARRLVAQGNGGGMPLREQEGRGWFTISPELSIGLKPVGVCCCPIADNVGVEISEEDEDVGGGTDGVDNDSVSKFSSSLLEGWRGWG